MRGTFQREYTAWMRMATWTARTSGCKRGPLRFSTKDLVLKQSKYYWSTAIVASQLWCSWLTLDLQFFVHGCASSDAKSVENIEGASSSSSIFAPTADEAELEWEQWKICLDIACLCVAKQTAKHKSHRALEKYSEIYGVGEYNLELFSWRVQSDSGGVAWSSPYLEKRCVSAPPICEEVHLECTETQDTSIKNCLHSIGPNSAVTYTKRQE